MSKYSKNYNQALYYKGKRIIEIHSPNYLYYFAYAVRNIIATAMTKVASIAHSVGAEFENVAAFLAQMIETTQEAPETLGTALKTVFARFAEVKKLYSEGQILGTDEEGEEINVNKIQEALRTVGISMTDFLTGKEGADQILLRLAEKWDSLNTVTQRYIATMGAGSRQQSRFISLLQDFGRTQELIAAANDSEGAAQKQFEKTLDSL
jgi:TP901 family phage tail tape measure protein